MTTPWHLDHSTASSAPPSSTLSATKTHPKRRRHNAASPSVNLSIHNNNSARPSGLSDSMCMDDSVNMTTSPMASPLKGAALLAGRTPQKGNKVSAF